MTAQRGPAVWTVRAITHTLPSGPIRTRYRQEFLAELHDLGPTARIRYTVRLAASSLALRAAVLSAKTAGAPALLTAPRKPLMCYIHHQWRIHTNPDGEAYGQCDRCGEDRFDGQDRLTDTGKTSANMAANIIGRPN